jgi:sulfate adenylyltransferase
MSEEVLNENFSEIPERLVKDENRRKELKTESTTLQTLTLTQRQLCDIEMILNGAFYPLQGFMDQTDYDSVVKHLRLADGTLFSMPITLDITEEQKTRLAGEKRIALLDQENNLIAIMTVGTCWEPNKALEAELVFGADDLKHPSVEYLHNTAGKYYLGGAVEGYQLPVHYDYSNLRRTPNELRKYFKENGWKRVVAFQTRNPLHRSHFELTTRAIKHANAHLLLNPVVGMTKPGDVDHHTRVRCYKSLMNHYEPGTALLSLLPLAMRMGGPREAIWHTVIRRNYGATHFIIGRDHAGPGNNSQNKPFYGEYDAQTLVLKYVDELKLKILTFQQVVFVPSLNKYLPEDELTPGMETKNISGTALRNCLMSGQTIPEWFSFPDVIRILQESYPPLHKQGFTVFFTGLSGSGKSTISNALLVKLTELISDRSITLLDGDVVRNHLSTELGFSKEHRELNIKRIAYVASEITKARGVALTAAIAPYRGSREYARKLIAPAGGFIEIYVATSLEVCEQRDRKGLYQKARSGLIKGFTGIDDPYEPPSNPELTIDTGKTSVAEAVDQIVYLLREKGYVRKEE